MKTIPVTPSISILLLLVFFEFASPMVRADEPNTLIAVHTVELNNKNKPIMRTYDNIYNTYKLISEETKKKKTINQNGKAKALYLEPGSYCFYATNFCRINLRISNSVCFRVAESGITNAGTWLIGVRASRNMYARLIDMKDNYLEVESILGVSGTTPAIMTLPEATE